MKLRKGFISNSSSTSFYILGCVVNKEMFRHVKNNIITVMKNDEDTVNTCNRYFKGDWESIASDYGEIAEIIGLIYEYSPAFDAFGLKLDKMKDDETLGELKQRIVDAFEKIGIKLSKRNIGWVYDCYENR